MMQKSSNPRSRDQRSEAQRRASFAQINASWAIEGQVMDAADRAMQERLIRGEVTHEQAISALRRRYRSDSTSVDRS